MSADGELGRDSGARGSLTPPSAPILSETNRSARVKSLASCLKIVSSRLYAYAFRRAPL